MVNTEENGKIKNMNTDILDYDNFFLPVSDLTQAKDFYQNKLGLGIKFDFSDAGMTAFSVGNQEPAIIVTDTNKIDRTKPAIWFRVDNVKVTYEQLKGRGVVFLSEPFQIQTGMAAQFEDPFGNLIGITDYTANA